MDPDLPIPYPKRRLHIRLFKEIRLYWIYFFVTITAGLLASLVGIGGAWSLSRSVEAVFLRGETIIEIRGLLIGLLILICIRSLSAWVSEKFASKLAIKIKTRLREHLYAHILQLGASYTQRYQTGILTNLLTNGIEALDAYFSQYVPQIVYAVLIPLSILICVFPVDPLSGLILALTAPIIPIFMVLITSISSNLTQRQWKTLSRMSAFFLDILQGLTTLKILGRSKDRSKVISQVSEHYRELTMSVLRVTFLSALVMELTATLSTAIIAVEIGIRLLYGHMAFGQAFFILVLVPEFYLPLRLLGLRFHSGMAGAASASQIFRVLDELPQTRAADQGDGWDKSRKVRHTQSIRFDNVTFAYDPNHPILEHISFEIKPRQKIALVGPSGAGKSTLASLLMRFITPDQGKIFADQNDIQSIPIEEWLENISWVPQRPYLFSDTVAANIRLAHPEASLEDVKTAAQLAHADEFIEELTDGYETQIGERGVRLSGGQAQRIALARAFLKDAPILIMDEPTANLDPELDTLLQESIQRLMSQKMVLVIAHRLTTVMKADQIFLIKGGIILESGTHQELIKQNGLYKQMAMSGEISLKSEFPERSYPEDIKSGAIKPASQFPSTNNVIDQQSKLSLGSSGMKSSLLTLLSFLIPYKNWVFLSILLGFLAITFGIGLISTSTYIISAAALQPSIAVLQVAIVGVRFFGIFRALFRYLERVVSHQVTFKLLAQLRVWFYQSVEPLAPARLMRFHSADLLSRIIGDISILENFFVRGAAPPMIAILVCIGMFLFFFQFNLGLAWIITLFLLIGGTVLPLWSWKVSQESGYQITHLQSKFFKLLVDGVQGLSDLTVFNRLNQYNQNIRAENKALSLAQEHLGALSAASNALSLLNASLALWAVLVFGSWLSPQEKIDAVMLGVFCLAALASFEAVQNLPQVTVHIKKDIEATQRLMKVVESDPKPRAPEKSKQEPENFNLEVKGVSFSYPNEEIIQYDSMPSRRSFIEEKMIPQNTLTDISFSLRSGEHIAIVGPSGAGKSTLANLLLRFWDYQTGQIILGGHELSQYDPEQLCQWFNVVSQDTFLFSGTIRENLLLAKPDAASAELDQAVKQAQLENLLASLPEGYQTWIGEQGVRLSAGERQRLALARAFLRDAPVLVLDEATSNLDTLLEQKILAEIQQYCRHRARLTITHRLVGLENANEILVLKQGRIIERGGYEELIKKKGFFNKMWELQNPTIDNSQL